MKRLVHRLINLIRRLSKKSNSVVFSAIMTAFDVMIYSFSNKTVLGNDLPKELQRWLGDLEKNGICIIENYWDSNQCAITRLEIDRLIAQYPDYLSDTAQSDIRLYGANNLSRIINIFTTDINLTSIATAYVCKESRAAFTLAARMVRTKSNLGSGEGWHRDDPVRQFKAILYLSDVDINNGPFQMIKNSHKVIKKISDTLIGEIHYPQFRIGNDQIESILAREKDRLITYVAQAGTLILVDTSSIHRGMPISLGERYALTNYYFPKDIINKELFKQFKVCQPPSNN